MPGVLFRSTDPSTEADELEIFISTTPTPLLPGETYNINTTVPTGTDPDPAGDGSLPSLDFVAHSVPDGTAQGQEIKIHQFGANAIRLDGNIDGFTETYHNSDRGFLYLVWDGVSQWQKGNTNQEVSGGTSSTIDSALSGASRNPVENQAIVNTLANGASIIMLNGGTY